jgi:2-C-methyl-D-erythritol 4-phosphate cytidylyltransferase
MFEWVGVHDAARPLVSQPLIDRVLNAARTHGAAAPAIPVHSTIKQAQGPLPARIQATLARDQLWAMQTPQIMRRTDLLDAYARCPIPLERITDDIQLLESTGRDTWLVEGEETNIKITTTQDLRLARSLMDDLET